MSRTDVRRLEDVLAAAAAIILHLERGPLIEIGEAVKGVSDDVRALAPDVPALVDAVRRLLADARIR